MNKDEFSKTLRLGGTMAKTIDEMAIKQERTFTNMCEVLLRKALDIPYTPECRYQRRKPKTSTKKEASNER